MIDTQELRKLAHQVLKLYIPKEKYDYVCGIIDMAHAFGASVNNNKESIFSAKEKARTDENFEN